MICSYCQKEFSSDLTIIDLFCYPRLPRRCQNCQGEFQTPKQPICPGCGRFGDEVLCDDCLVWRQKYPTLLKNHGLFPYDERFKTWIYSYKYLGDYRLKGAFAVELKRAVRKYPSYVICPLPLSKERFLERGFNQVDACFDAAMIPYRKLLVRQENTAPQARKSKSERLAMTQPFGLCVTQKEIVNQKILLADDVYTTGRTLFYAADILWKHGAKCVKSLTFAR